MTHAQDKILSLAWYIVQCSTGKEEKTAEALRDLGCTPAVPKVTRMVKVRNMRRKRQERSYVGYKSHVLLGVDREAGLEPVARPILDIHWVRGFVGLSGFASRLRAEQVYRFLTHGAWDKRSVSQLVEAWKPDYQVGQTVKLRGAGFDGVTGLAWSVCLETRKAQFKVPFLGSERIIEAPLEAAYLHDPNEEKEAA